MNLGSLTTTQFDIQAGGVAWITLNRPTVANARNQIMREELLRIYETIADNSEVRVVVLTGSGDRHFCAGMDLNEAGRVESVVARRARMRRWRDIDALAELPLPTIAAVNGTALGGGLEMVLACDLRVASTEAKLGLPEVSLGLIPGGGATQRLTESIGRVRAMDLLLLGTRISGREAADIGLVNEHLAYPDLMPRVRQLASTIAELDPRAVRFLKEAVSARRFSSWEHALYQETELLNLLLAARADSQPRA